MNSFIMLGKQYSRDTDEDSYSSSYLSSQSSSDSDEEELPQRGLRRAKTCMDLTDRQECETSLRQSQSEPIQRPSRKPWSPLIDTTRTLNYYFYYRLMKNEDGYKVFILSDRFPDIDGLSFSDMNKEIAKRKAVIFSHTFFDSYITDCINEDLSIPTDETQDLEGKHLLAHRIVVAELNVSKSPRSFIKTLTINWKLSIDGFYPHEILEGSHSSDDLPELVTTVFNLPSDASKSSSKIFYSMFHSDECYSKKRKEQQQRVESALTM